MQKCIINFVKILFMKFSRRSDSRNFTPQKFPSIQYIHVRTYIPTCHMGEAYIKGAYSTDKTHVALRSHEQRVIDCPFDKIHHCTCHMAL